MLERNPARDIRAPRVIAPLPNLLFESECDRLLTTASRDPRPFLLVLLLLETGLKKAELLELRVDDFDFSNRYQPELWARALWPPGVQGPQAQAADTADPGV